MEFSMRSFKLQIMVHCAALLEPAMQNFVPIALREVHESLGHFEP